MKIGLDFDNTLVDLTWLFKRVFAKNNKIFYSSENWKLNDYPKKIKNEIYDLFENEKIMCNLPILPEVKYVLNYWEMKGHNFIIITARSSNIKDGTINFIKREFGNIPIIFNDFPKPKLPLIKKEKIDVWIDDNVHDIKEVTEAGIKCIMISNENTIYNWHLRNDIEWYPAIKDIKYENWE